MYVALPPLTGAQKSSLALHPVVKGWRKGLSDASGACLPASGQVDLARARPGGLPKDFKQRMTT